MRFSDLPIQRPIAILMFLLSLLVLGLVAIPRLPLDFMPIIEAPFVQVVVPYPGGHPLENLNVLVKPLEEELATIPGVQRISAEASPDEAQVSVRFNWSANLDLKKMEVREAVERVRPELPAEIGRIRIQTFLDGPGDGAIMEGRISARRNLSESWDLLERRILKPLERIQGVASVRLDGVRPQEVRIELNPDLLRRHGIEARELVRLLQQANTDLDLGVLQGDVLRYQVRAVGRFSRLEEIRDLHLGSADLRLRDVAAVELKEPPLDYGRHLEGEFAIGISVFKEPAANTVHTVDLLMERIDEVRNDPELRGITVLVWLNSGEEIRKSLAGLRSAGVFGGLLAVIVLFLFLRRLRTTLIVAVAIPFSLVVACGLMYILGVGLNVLTMLGLMVGVGMLVDNAVVVIENIHRRQGQGMEAREAARLGSQEVSLAVLAATATSIIVWLWLFTIERGHPLTIYLGAVALTISLAVACSLLISLTFIPLAAARFVPRREVRPGFLLRRLVPAYREVLAWTLRHRLLALGALILLASSAAIPLLNIEISGNPREMEREVAIHYNVHDAVNKEIMESHVNTVEAWLETRREELGISSVYSWYQERGRGQTRVYLPWENLSAANLAALRKKLEADLPVIPGVDLEVGDRRGFRHGRRDRRFVSVALHGEDPEYLRDVAVDVEARLRSLEDVEDIFGPSSSGQLEARIIVAPDRSRSLGVSPADVAAAVAFTYRGRQLRRFQGSQGEVEMLLGLPEDAQPGLASLDSLVVQRADGESVPLGSVATVEITRTQPEIEREERKTSQWVTVEFDKSVTTDSGKARVAERLAGLTLPEGYSWDWGTGGRDDDEALGMMLQGVILSLALVVILMAALFESFLQALAILITLPLAFFGAFWALWLLGFDLEVVAFMGVIILIGMVVNNGIVMVDHVNNLRRAGRPRLEAMLEGCGDRLRPVLMTTITTVFGLLPLAMSQFTVGNIYVDSMAVVIIGGLVSSTIFTLVALPVWYTMLEDLGVLLRHSLLPRRRPEARAALASAPASSPE